MTKRFREATTQEQASHLPAVDPARRPLPKNGRKAYRRRGVVADLAERG